MLRRRRNRSEPAPDAPLPLPRFEMRELVGPTEPADFELPPGERVYGLAPEAYARVFDFGCGCGRVARMLIGQDPQPERYLGIDLHRGMVRWAQRNLTPHAPHFRFLHHDVFHPSFNPGRGKPSVADFPAPDASFSLVFATSVFTHLTEDQAVHYLGQCARILEPDGMLHGTWFLFDKRDFPMMQPDQNALYINLADPSNAVIFDRDWLRRAARSAGLVITDVDVPVVRGHQWSVVMKPARQGLAEAQFPPDVEEIGQYRSPRMPENAAKIE